LRQDIEGPLWDAETIQFPFPNRKSQSRALYQFIASERKEAAFGQASQPVAGSSHALKQNAYGSGRANLTDKVHLSDINA
jgi:hypothetical protein